MGGNLGVTQALLWCLKNHPALELRAQLVMMLAPAGLSPRRTSCLSRVAASALAQLKSGCPLLSARKRLRGVQLGDPPQGTHLSRGLWGSG